MTRNILILLKSLNQNYPNTRKFWHGVLQYIDGQFPMRQLETHQLSALQGLILLKAFVAVQVTELPPTGS